jgi:hypothetical protein
VHPQVAGIEGELKPVVPAQITTMPPRFTTRHRDREGRLARMLEHHVDVVALAGDVPDRLAELAGLFSQSLYSGVPTFGIWPQHLKFLRLITPLAPRLITKSRLSIRPR